MVGIERERERERAKKNHHPARKKAKTHLASCQEKNYIRKRKSAYFLKLHSKKSNLNSYNYLIMVEVNILQRGNLLSA
jgi:hypothetical protein